MGGRIYRGSARFSELTLKKSWDQESTEPEVVSPILTVGVNNMEDPGHGLLTGVSKENTLSSATLDFLT